jgi:hypothetical protein
MADSDEIKVDFPAVQKVNEKMMLCCYTLQPRTKLYFLKDASNRNMGGFVSLPVMMRFSHDTFDAKTHAAVEQAALQQYGQESIPLARDRNHLESFGGKQSFDTWHSDFEHWLHLPGASEFAEAFPDANKKPKKRRKKQKKLVLELLPGKWYWIEGDNLNWAKNVKEIALEKLSTEMRKLTELAKASHIVTGLTVNQQLYTKRWTDKKTKERKEAPGARHLLFGLTMGEVLPFPLDTDAPAVEKCKIRMQAANPIADAIVRDSVGPQIVAPTSKIRLTYEL